ncbi:MAG: hypothetical protein E7658_08530 [Ruminococcaceae bacterium]|nr:hypothetical protein [Oscillospiraceae bacterium]
MKKILLALLTGALVLCGCNNTTTDETDANESGITEETPAETEAVPEITFVTYEEFGAVGDGVTNDYEAIRAAHRHANDNNLPVRAKDDAVYYIGEAEDSISVKTSTDWGNAHFIIDDKGLENIYADIFRVESMVRPYSIELTSLTKDQTNIGITLESDCMLYLMDSNTKRYTNRDSEGEIRKYSYQQDAIYVYADGTIHPKTTIDWDYEQFTEITAYPIPDETLYLTGGYFTTLEPDEAYDGQIRRGILIIRSNTVVDGLVHTLVEGEVPAHCSGFLRVESCANVEINNTQLTARRFRGQDSGNDSDEFRFESCCNLTVNNMQQLNDITDTGLWGVTVSNWTKNVSFDNCTLNRIDAHQSLTNLTVTNCNLGYTGINVVGGGTLYVENCTSTRPHMVSFRSDYGGIWDGDVIIKNCTLIPTVWVDYDTIPWTGIEIIGSSSTETNDWGFESIFTRSVTIEGLHIENPENITDINVFSSPSSNYHSESAFRRWRKAGGEIKYPYIMPTTVSVSGISVANTEKNGEFVLRISPNEYMFFEQNDTQFYIDGVLQEN